MTTQASQAAEPPATTRGHMEHRLKGLALSEGYALARVCLFNESRHSNLPMYRVSGSGVDLEKSRLARSVEIALDRLETIRLEVVRTIGKAEAEIFVAQKMILEDAAVIGKIRHKIETDQINAESAADLVFNEYEAMLLKLDNEYIRERASDLGEIKRRLLDVMGNMRPELQCHESKCQRGHNRIVVAEELTPSLTIEIDAAHTVGFVTERGGTNSHAAILARALGIPAVSGLPKVRNLVGCGSDILINGYTGEVVIWPTPETIGRIRKESGGPSHRPDVVEPVNGFRVMANVNMLSEIRESREMKAEGIGLYRTEFEVMAAGRFFSEQELFDRYAAAIRGMGGATVLFRLLDIGSDKQLPFMAIPREENPSLGWRGARLLLARRELLRTQARALAMCSIGHCVNVMYPMIVDVQQFRDLKAAFEESVQDLPRGEIRHGIMFEVPSACLQARELYREIDFGSIGTNDLTQYLFAVDRDNERVSYDYNPDRPVFWNLIRSIADAAREAGKPLSICGELAGDPRHTARLLELGISSVSVTARRIPGVRKAAMESLKSGK